MKIRNKLYKGKEIVVFDSFKHKYWSGDNEVVSVTKALGVIAKPALINWAARMTVEAIAEQLEADKPYTTSQLQAILNAGQQAHWRKKEDAGNLGSIVHEQIEKIIKGETPMELGDEKARDAVKRFTDWADEHDVKFLLAEQVVYSKKYNFVGTADFICKIDGKLWLGDIKTSKGLYPEFGAQVAAYHLARTEEFPEEKYAGAVIVRVGKKKLDFETWEIGVDEIKPYQNVFLSALMLYNNLERIGG